MFVLYVNKNDGGWNEDFLNVYNCKSKKKLWIIYFGLKYVG